MQPPLPDPLERLPRPSCGLLVPRARGGECEQPAVRLLEMDAGQGLADRRDLLLGRGEVQAAVLDPCLPEAGHVDEVEELAAHFDETEHGAEMRDGDALPRGVEASALDVVQ